MSNYKIIEKIIHRKPKVLQVDDYNAVFDSVPKIQIEIDGYILCMTVFE